MTKTISPTDNIIDSRDVIARIGELTVYRDEALQAAVEARKAEAEDGTPGEPLPDNVQAAIDNLWIAEDGTEYDTTDDWGEDEAAELQGLQSLAEEGESISGWEDGAYLINEDHFEDYARQFAEDIGAIDRSTGWPACHIDWEAAADSLKQDYTAIEWQGTTFYVGD